jgi:hypothetical protein
VPYGYLGHAIGVHSPSGLLQVSSVGGRQTVRDHEVCTVTLPDPEDVCSTEDCGASLLDNEGYDGLCGTCADVAEAPATERSSEPPSASSEPRPASPGAPVDWLTRIGDTVEWWVKVGGQGGDSTTEVNDLPDAITLWQQVLEEQPLADVQILSAVNGQHLRVYADVEHHDTCSVHDAVFDKEGPCPVCVEEDEDDPAALERAGDSATAAVLRSLLERHSQRGPHRVLGVVLTDAERDAVVHAIYVLEG